MDSHTIQGLQSDGVLAHVRGALEALGYQVESGMERRHRIVRPVLFGDQGRPRVNYEIDAVHDTEGVRLEVEADRAMMASFDWSSDFDLQVAAAATFHPRPG
jgi:hypothetical protein